MKLITAYGAASDRAKQAELTAVLEKKFGHKADPKIVKEEQAYVGQTVTIISYNHVTADSKNVKSNVLFIRFAVSALRPPVARCS